MQSTILLTFGYEQSDFLNYKTESNQRSNGTKPPKAAMDTAVQNASPSFCLDTSAAGPGIPGNTGPRHTTGSQRHKPAEGPRAEPGIQRLTEDEMPRSESGLSPNKQIKPKEWVDEAHSTDPGKKKEAKVEKQPQRKKSIS